LKTFKQHIKKLNRTQFEQLKSYCLHSNSLYNCSLYITRQYFFETNKYIGYNELYKQLKDSIHYQSLPAKIAQQTIRLMDKDFRSFFGLLKMKRDGNYQAKVHIPHYKDKNKEFILILPNDQVSFRNNIIKITRDIKLKFNHNIDGIIKQVIIEPKKHNYYEINIQYQETNNNNNLLNINTLNKEGGQTNTNNYELNENNYLSIDLGINNFATCFSNVGHSFIVNGKPLKSINQFYNKRKAEQQSIIKIVNDKNYSNKLTKLTINRKNKINNFMNKTVYYIVMYCIEHKIKNLVIGYNELWKQEVNLGSKTNQNFVNIPYNIFKQKLENKCSEYGIIFNQQEESYTSKCSSLDLEDVQKHDVYLGKRIKRGLFKSNVTNKIINADVNGSINILRKHLNSKKLNKQVISEIININEIERLIVSPIKLNPIQFG